MLSMRAATAASMPMARGALRSGAFDGAVIHEMTTTTPIATRGAIARIRPMSARKALAANQRLSASTVRASMLPPFAERELQVDSFAQSYLAESSDEL